MLRDTLLIALHVLLLAVEHSQAYRCDLDARNAEGRLKEFLLCHRDTSGIPSPVDAKHPLIVDVALHVKEFVTYGTGSLKLNLITTLSWNVSGYAWDAQHYENITRVVVAASQIWEPHLIALDTHTQGDHSSFCSPNLCAITSDGNVTCSMKCAENVGCQMSSKNWPYDKQNCSMVVGVNKNEKLALRLASDLRVDHRDSQDGEWRMVDFVAEEFEGRLRVGLVVERHVIKYQVAFVRPTFVLFLSNVLPLVMVPSCRERLVLIGFNLLMHRQFLMEISSVVPQNGDPSMYIFIGNSLITTVMLLLHSILMRYLYECRRPVPERLRGVIRVLSRVSLADRFAQMGYFVDKKCTRFVSSMVTVESQIRVDRATNVYEDWQRLAAAVDRLLLPLIVVWYILM